MIERDLQGEIESLRKVKQAQREHEQEQNANAGTNTMGTAAV